MTRVLAGALVAAALLSGCTDGGPEPTAAQREHEYQRAYQSCVEAYAGTSRLEGMCGNMAADCADTLGERTDPYDCLV